MAGYYVRVYSTERTCMSFLSKFNTDDEPEPFVPEDDGPSEEFDQDSPADVAEGLREEADRLQAERETVSPTMGRVVLYRRNRYDSVAIITQTADTHIPNPNPWPHNGHANLLQGDQVHLAVFAADIGKPIECVYVADRAEDPDDPDGGTWRFPEHVRA